VTTDALPARIGRYDVVSLLGKGGMAEVFKVKAREGPLVGRELALKRLLPALTNDVNAVDLFTNEAELSRHLKHPNIVEVYDAGFEGDDLYMVMELIDGRDVDQIIKQIKARGLKWPVDFAVYLARSLLDALGYAHAAKGPNGRPLGIVHCDVSPSNFFISRTGDLRLGDFGVAKSRIENKSDLVMGKPFYLAPEAMAGDLVPSVDIWAVAVTLYELLTLERPFVGKRPEDIYRAVLATQFIPPTRLRPELPRVFDALFNRAFQLHPQKRFMNAQQFSEALRPLYDERVGTPLAISALVRLLFPSSEG
jgi:eukaryotic-like serine/threonine-protein kinase